MLAVSERATTQCRELNTRDRYEDLGCRPRSFVCFWNSISSERGRVEVTLSENDAAVKGFTRVQPSARILLAIDDSSQSSAAAW